MTQDRQIWIMCQGEQRRLAHLGKPKQLAEVGGEPILRRTLRLLRELGQPQPLIIGKEWAIPESARDAEIRDNHYNVVETLAESGLSVVVSRPRHAVMWASDPGSCILDGLALAMGSDAPGNIVRSDWRTLVLLGDVIWSADALAAVVDDWTSPSATSLRFAGTIKLTQAIGEIYACWWPASQHGVVRQLLRTAPCRKRMDGSPMKFSQQQGGHLRRLMWHAASEAIEDRKMTESWWIPGQYLPITDWTMDLDDDGDLRMLPHVAAMIRKEGSGPP